MVLLLCGFEIEGEQFFLNKNFSVNNASRTGNNHWVPG